MKKKLCCVLLLFCQCGYSFEFVDFDVSMKADLYTDFLSDQRIEKMYSVFKHIYNKSMENFALLGDYQSIPKRFHYIWLGSPLPKKFIPYLASWVEKHPDWSFVFWVDNAENYDLGVLLEDADFDDVAAHLQQNKEQFSVVDVKHLSFKNKTLFDNATNYAEKSDILSYEVVYRFGGVYIDVDMECLLPLDCLIDAYDFFTGLQPLDTNMVQLGLALFGACPGHPIIKNAVETLEEDQQYEKIVVKTGPIHFTKSFITEIFDDHHWNAVFPASYFYPCDYNQAGCPADEW